MKNIPFDIETKPDFEAVKKYTKKFDRDKVAVGNRGEEKAEEKRDADEAKYWADAFSKAALNPTTSTICAIGLALPDDSKVKILQGDEFSILTQFWSYFREFQSDRWVFYTANNGRGMFDIRHIYTRSLKLKVAMPFGIVSHNGYFVSAFVDLATVFLAGADNGTFYGLDRCCQFLDLIGEETRVGKVVSKQDLESLGITGANFHEFQESDPEIAEAYLKNDVRMTLALAERLY